MNQMAINFLASRSDPDTSHQAASRSAVFRAKHEAAIFEAITQAGERGATYREIAKITGMEPVAVGRRLSAMGARKLITRHLNEFGDPAEVRNGCAVWWRT